MTKVTAVFWPLWIRDSSSAPFGIATGVASAFGGFPQFGNDSVRALGKGVFE